MSLLPTLEEQIFRARAELRMGLAVAVGGWDERDHIEPVEAMAEAALQLCWRPADALSGEVVCSLPLLERLGVPVRTLQGNAVLTAA